MRDPARTAFGAAHVRMPSDDRAPANGPVIVSQLSPEELERYRSMGKSKEKQPIGISIEGVENKSMPALTKEKYVQACEEGKTDEQIADECGWTIGTLKFRKSKWGINSTNRPMPKGSVNQVIPFDFDAYKKMRERGMSQPEISQYFGMELEDLKQRVATEKESRKPKVEPLGPLGPELNDVKPDPVPTPPETLTIPSPEVTTTHYAFAEQVIRFTVKSIAESVYQTALEKGWHDTPTSFPTAIALIHSEVSEALEADRKGKGAMAVAEELADVVIRVMDTAEAKGLDLAGALFAKMQKNREREWRHGGLPY